MDNVGLEKRHKIFEGWKNWETEVLVKLKISRKNWHLFESEKIMKI